MNATFKKCFRNANQASRNVFKKFRLGAIKFTSMRGNETPAFDFVMTADCEPIYHCRSDGNGGCYDIRSIYKITPKGSALLAKITQEIQVQADKIAIAPDYSSSLMGEWILEGLCDHILKMEAEAKEMLQRKFSY